MPVTLYNYVSSDKCVEVNTILAIMPTYQYMVVKGEIVLFISQIRNVNVQMKRR